MRNLDVVGLAVCACLVSLPSEAQTATGLSQGDVAKIDQLTETYVKATLAKDWATCANLHQEDAVRYPPNEPAVKGRAAIKAWHEKGPPITEMSLTNVKVDGRGGLAYAVGTYALTVAPPGAPGPIKDSGRWLCVERRQPDGKWLIELAIWNSELPATPSPK